MTPDWGVPFSRWVATFTVSAPRDAAFPLEMLNLDCCWPASPEDAAALPDGQFAGVKSRRYIQLSTNLGAAPSRAEWSARGWRVEITD